MLCILCRQDTKVTNSRLRNDSNRVWRRRECLNCKKIITTHEHMVIENTLCVTKNSTKKSSAFKRDKLFLSIYKSCQHRPNAIDEASTLVQTVQNLVLKNLSSEKVSADTIRAHTITVLARFDPISMTVYKATHPSRQI